LTFFSGYVSMSMTV